MTWRTLLDIAEQTHAQIAGAALQRACGSAAPELVRAGALVRTAEAALLAPLTAWDSDDDAFDYGYEEGGVELTGARVRVVQPTHDPYVYRLNLDWMLRSAATALGIRRTAPLTETIPDTLWRLGVAAAGDRDCIFFLARRLYQDDVLVKVLAELSALLHSEPLIVLTTAERHPGVPVSPGIRFVSLHDCALARRRQLLARPRSNRRGRPQRLLDGRDRDRILALADLRRRQAPRCRVPARADPTRGRPQAA